jgi:quercetin dioxygenase-like cupin family protein
MKFHRRHGLAALCGIAAVVGMVLFVVPALATSPSMVTTTIFAVGHFDNINSTTKTALNPTTSTGSDSEHERNHERNFWKARIETNGASDLYVLQNTIAPGGTFGWHSHPGPSLVIVKSGTGTFYEANDPTCSPHVVQAGSGFVDNGNDTHVVRNEGSVDLVTVVTSLVPSGFQRRIDQPAPANCPNLPNG